MADEHETAWGPESADADLITAVRQGDTGAFGVLYQRHATAARTVAGQYLRSASEADDAVADAFTKVLAILSGGGGPDIAFRAYLFTVVRRRAFEMVNGARRTQPTDDVAAFESAFGPLASTEEPALQGFERTTVAQAFRSLPERWQSVLWYSEVEGLAPAAIAPILGLTANGAAALAYRAREGLREAYLQQHLTSAPADECRRANPLLGSFVRGGLAKRETAVVEHHLEDCGECRALVLELGDVAHGMRAVIAPLVLGLAGIGLVGTALPTWGSAAGAATATALAAGAPAASGGSSTAGGTAAASGTGAASAGGLAGALAAAPALVVGLAALVVVAAGLGVAALLGAFGDDEKPSADPVSTSTSSDTAGPTDGATDGTTDSTLDPTTDPSSPTTLPAPPATEDDGTDTTDGTDASRPETTGPDDATDPSGLPGAPPTTRPTAPVSPVAPPTAAPVVPTPAVPTPIDPTPVIPTPVDPTPAPVSLDLGIGLASGTSLVARQNNTLELSLSNAGLELVTDVAVELTIPSGLTFVPDAPVTSGAFGPRVLLLDAGDWTCIASGDGGAQAGGATVVRCEVPEIPSGASSDLTLDVYAQDAATSVTITTQVFVGSEPLGDATTKEWPIALAPARLDVGVVAVADLVAGRPGHVAVEVANLGQETAGGTSVVVPLAPGSGLTWRTTAGALEPAEASTGSWTCAASSLTVASCINPDGVAGDGASTVVLPVSVAAGSTFDGTVVPVVGHAGAPAGQPGEAQPLTVVARGLSAAALLQGTLRTAQVSAPVGETALLTVPAGATVRHAELVWSGSDAEGLSAAALASVELRGEAGGLGTRSMVGTAVTLDAPGAGQGYWAASDVTSLLVDHASTGRWLVAPLQGAIVPADLRWSLTVVLDVADQPASTVTLLSGPPPADGPPAARTLTLPADGPVTVSATAAARGQVPPRLVANGQALPAPTGTEVLTYRSGGLLQPVAETAAPFALSLTLPSGGTGAGAFDTLVVHASGVSTAGGPLDQPAGPTGPSVVVDPVLPSLDGSAVPLSVHNDGGLPVTSVQVLFDLPPGQVVVRGVLDGSTCSAVTQGGQRFLCVVATLQAGQHATLPLDLLAPAGTIGSGNLTYTVSGLDPLTGETFLSDGVLVLAVP